MFRVELDRLEPAEQESVMEIVTSWMAQGIEQGIEQGIKRERSLILRLLSRKVGVLPDSVRSRVAAIAIIQLESLGEALLDFSNLSDLETWLAENAEE